MKIEQLSENIHFLEMVNTDQKELYKSNLNCGRHPSIVRNLKALSNDILQPIRDFFDVPLIITSGYRYPQLNKKVKGSENSQHLYGEASDFYLKGVSNKDAFIWITCSSNLVYGQVILEPSWIHISYPKMYKEYRKNLIAERIDGKMRYRRVKDGNSIS